MLKNKKVINIYQLTLSLVAIFTYIMPISKVYYDSGKSVTISVVFNTANILMLICLLLVAFFCAYNLFSDNYHSGKLINSLCFLAFLFVSVNVVIYSQEVFFALSTTYIVLFYELLLLNAIMQFNAFIWSFKEFKKYIKKHFIKRKQKNKTPKQQSMLKTELIIKRNAEIKALSDNIEKNSFEENNNTAKDIAQENKESNIKNIKNIDENKRS